MPSSPAVRLAFAYVAIFAWMGAYLPYWPVWLAARGMSSTQIGILLGITPWTRVFANPLAGRWADRSGHPERLIKWLGVALMIGLVGMSWLHGFVGLLLGMIVVGIAVAPINPLTDGMTVSAEAEGQLRYGSVRLWGSLAFILASWLGGELLERSGEPVVLWMLTGLAGFIVLTSLLLPAPRSAGTSAGDLDDPAARARDSTGRSPLTPSGGVAPSAAARPTVVPGSRAFVGFLIVTGLLNASHAVLYALGTQHWRLHGLDEGTVGKLWALGVLAEIVLFAFGARVGRWVSPRRLWQLAGLGGMVRWAILASTVALPWMIVAQLLHALTFGALHLGAMAFIRQRILPSARGRATTSYAAIATGLSLGVALPLAGVLYEHFTGDAYWVMGGLSAAALLGTIGRWSPRRS